MNNKFTTGSDFEEPKRDVKPKFTFSGDEGVMVGCPCYEDKGVVGGMKRALVRAFEIQVTQRARDFINDYGICSIAERSMYAQIVVGFVASLAPHDGKGGPDVDRTKEEIQANRVAQTAAMEEFIEDIRAMQKLLFDRLEEHSK